MELGNLIFGNSRGEFPVPRTDAWSEPWERLMEKIGRSARGEPLDDEGEWVFESETCLVRPYDWDAECDCGAEQKMDDWSAANRHGERCYQTALSAEMAEYDKRTGFALFEASAFGGDQGMMRGFDEAVVDSPSPGVTVAIFSARSDASMNAWREASDIRRKAEEATRKRLCSERSLPFPSGSMFHCDCGRDKKADAYWQQIGGHSSVCRLVQPNFLFKPNGFRLNWYKYPFRDAYMSSPLKPSAWRKMMAACAPTQPSSEGLT